MHQLRKKDHPRTVALSVPESAADKINTPLAECRTDQFDADLRHRLISERAYARYCERGYADGYDLDDWLEAEAEVDRLGIGTEETETV